MSGRLTADQLATIRARFDTGFYAQRSPSASRVIGDLIYEADTLKRDSCIATNEAARQRYESAEARLRGLQAQTRAFADALERIASVDCQIACASLPGMTRCVTCVARAVLSEAAPVAGEEAESPCDCADGGQRVAGGAYCMCGGRIALLAPAATTEKAET